MYLLSQLWLYLLLACLAGICLGFLIRRWCSRRAEAERMEAIETERQAERSLHAKALAELGRTHQLALSDRDADIATLRASADKDRQAADQAQKSLADERSGLLAKLAALTLTHQTLQGEHTTRGAQFDELQGRYDALDTTHKTTMAEHAEVARQAYTTLQERDASVSVLKQARDLLRDENDGLRAQVGQLTQKLAGTTAVVVASPRPAVSAVATMTSADLETQVMAAGAGQAPARALKDPGLTDDLKVIDGIGQVNELWLHEQGVWYFWQIASWGPSELAWVAHHLPNFGTRVYRENWVAQAAQLAAARPAT